LLACGQSVEKGPGQGWIARQHGEEFHTGLASYQVSVDHAFLTGHMILLAVCVLSPASFSAPWSTVSSACNMYFAARFADPHHFYADPHLDFYFKPDPDPAFHINSDLCPEPAPHQSAGNLRPLFYRTSRAPS
jgi:hypothetical protein